MDLFSEDYKTDDLTTVKKLLEESRNAFLLLFNNSPICMSMTAVTPEKRTYFRANKKFQEIFGYAESEIIGRTSVEVGILDAAESVRVGNIIKEKGGLQNDYIKCIAKDGKIVHTISSIEKMVLNGETYLVSFFINITKITEQQNTIERQLKQLETINGELEAFSYSVSHDLRAPLRAISGYAKILESDFSSALDEDGIKLLFKVQHNAKRMSELIDDLLTFARLGKKDIVKNDLDMRSLIDEVVSELKSLDHKAKISIDTLHPVKGDRALLKQVIINLLSNAIKYSAKKEEPLIRISSSLNDGTVIYSFSDNGEGFDMKYADKLFRVFQRLHSNEDFEGTGIGLVTVKRIVNKHGGNIWAQAEVNKGATFQFSLPVH